MIIPQFDELIERIDFLNVTAPYDADGVGTIVSTAASNVWSKIEFLGGEIGEQAQRIQDSTQAFRIWIRYRTDLTPWMQIRWGTRRLLLTGPIEHFDKRFSLINAAERVSRSL